MSPFSCFFWPGTVHAVSSSAHTTKALCDWKITFSAAVSWLCGFFSCSSSKVMLHHPACVSDVCLSLQRLAARSTACRRRRTSCRRRWHVLRSNQRWGKLTGFWFLCFFCRSKQSFFVLAAVWQGVFWGGEKLQQAHPLLTLLNLEVCFKSTEPPSSMTAPEPSSPETRAQGWSGF